jgi:hypothetical protein
MTKEINLVGSASTQKNEASSGAIVVLYDNMEIKEQVNGMWAQVFGYSDRILRSANLSEFVFLAEKSGLDLQQMVYRLYMLDASMQFAIDYGPALGLDHIHINMILNAKEQLRRMKRLSDASQTKDQNEYNLAIAELKKQAVLSI